MNARLMIRLLSAVQLIEAATIVPSVLISWGMHDGEALPLLLTIGLLLVIFGPLFLFVRPKNTDLRAKEGFFVVAMSWILLSLFGALPFVFGGMIPNFVDALFESVSGFTTTGATVLEAFDGLPAGLMFWRAFTHWIGGMGVLVLTLAILPRVTGRTSSLVRAESPGPSLSKIVPKMGQTAKILYLLYAALTVAEFIALLIAGLSPYDAAIHALSTAGTGGYSNYGASVAAFNSPAVEIIITVFMVVFGINFALYYQLLTGHVRDALHSEELRWFLCFFLAAVVLITVLVTPLYGNVLTALRQAGFQSASFMSTTGFSTTDYTLWPAAAQFVLVLLMLVGSCAGSTAGGLKVVRMAILLKVGRRSVMNSFQPRKVQVIRFEGKAVDETMIGQIAAFFFLYIMLMFSGSFFISLDSPYGFSSNFTAGLSCISNVGPILTDGAAISSMQHFGPFAKVIMCLLMLAGRLELFPLLAIFHPRLWRAK